MKYIRYFIFLKDVLRLACTAFGGPQAHLAMFFKILVKKRAYISEEELINLYSFCQILPGPASTQTITAVGFRLGGPQLAFLTLLVWVFPAVTIMTIAGILLSYFQLKNIPLNFTKFIEPIAIGFVIFAAVKISFLVLKTRLSVFLCLLTVVLGFLVKSPAIFPIALLLCGAISALQFKKEKSQIPKEKIKIEWANLILFVGVAIGSAVLGHFTRSLPDTLPINLAIRLFENFFRNGSLVFGGGQTLIAVLHKQFVQFKGYLTPDEFLSGYALLQVLPGPLFSFSSFVGSMAMRNYGLNGQIIGGIVGAVGIFLPGTLLIFFVIRFWDKVKNNSVIRASLEGVNAGSAGILIATTFLLSQTIAFNWLNSTLAISTFLILQYTKIPPPLIIIAGIVAGFVF